MIDSLNGPPGRFITSSEDGQARVMSYSEYISMASETHGMRQKANLRLQLAPGDAGYPLQSHIRARIV